MKKFLIFVLVLIFLVGIGTVNADTASTSATSTVTASTTTTFLAELNSLLQQMKTLREKIITLIIQNLSSAQTKRDKIILLQSLLSQDKDLYPEGAITGNMGNLTKKAIFKFIKKNSLKISTSTDATLRGPARLLIEGAGNSGKIPPGLLTAPGIAKKLGATSSASSNDNQGKGLKNTIKNLLKLR